MKKIVNSEPEWVTKFNIHKVSKEVEEYLKQKKLEKWIEESKKK